METAFVLGGRGGLRRRSRGALGTWLGLGIVAVLVLIPLRGLYRFTGGTMEEGFMLYFPERLARGDVPNVDFLHLYGPGSLHVLAGWYGVLGHTLAAERTFGLLQHVAVLAALFALARPWGRAVATVTAGLTVFYVVTPVALTAMAWNGGIALVLWSTVLAVRGIHLAGRMRRWTWAGSGLLAGLALTYRPDLVVAVALVLGWLMWCHRASVGPVLGAALVGLIPMWVHLGMAGPGPSFEGMVLDPVVHLRGGRELPRPPSWGRLDGALQAVAESVPPWWRLPHLAASHTIFVWFFLMFAVAAGLLALAVVLRHRDRAPTGRTDALLAVGLVSVGILPQGLQRPDSAHLLWVTCVSFPFLAPATAELVTRWRPALSPRRVATIAGAVAVAVTFVFTSLFTFRYYLLYARIGLGQVPAPFEVRRGDRTFFLGQLEAYQGIQAAVDELDRLATPGDRLLVGPSDLSRTWYSDVFVYWLFPELEPATYYVEMDPGLANAEGSSLADDVRSADWVFLTGLWDGWNEPNTSGDAGSDAPNQVLRDHFCVVGSWAGEATLHRRCR